jgi:hypothetical protein
MKNALIIVLFALAACSSQPSPQKPEPVASEQPIDVSGVIGQM